MTDARAVVSPDKVIQDFIYEPVNIKIPYATYRFIQENNVSQTNCSATFRRLNRWSHKLDAKESKSEGLTAREYTLRGFCRRASGNFAGAEADFKRAQKEDRLATTLLGILYSGHK